MPLFSSIGRFFASIVPPSSRKHDLWGHLIYIPSEGHPASDSLRLLQQFSNSASGLLGHLVVADMQLWKERENPEHEFIVARVLQVKEADSLPPYAKGSELASASILIARNEFWDPLRSGSSPPSSRASSESAMSASQHGSADPQPILDSHVRSGSAPDLLSSAHPQESPPVPTDDATPVLADGAKGSTASLRIPCKSERRVYDKFNVYPGKSIWSITWFRDAVCVASMDFTTASRPLLFEELAMMAMVTSDSATECLTPTTHAYWYAALVWGMAILHTGAKPKRVKSWLRPLLIGASNRGPLPSHVLGVDDELKPAELLKTFLHKWDRYKAGLIRRGELYEKARRREIYEALVNEARKLAEEQTSRIAMLEQMIARLDGTTSA